MKKDMASPKKQTFVRDFHPKELSNVGELTKQMTEQIALPLHDIIDMIIKTSVEIISEKRGNPCFSIKKKKNGDLIVEVTAKK